MAAVSALSLDLDKRAQLTQGRAPGFLRKGFRPLHSYERFSHETSVWVPAEVGALREMVRDGLRLGRAEVWRVRPHTVRAHVNTAGSCDAPVVTHLRGVELPMLGLGAEVPNGMRAYLVTCARRCRVCEPCRLVRKLQWADRSLTEYFRSARTWHLTITFTPFAHARLDARISARAKKAAAFELNEWTAEELFRKRERVCGEELTRWLKRVRVKEQRRRNGELEGVMPSSLARLLSRPSASFSYLLVAEEHRSAETSPVMLGRPHYHMLIHERRKHELVREHEVHRTAKGEDRVDDGALLKTEWKLGWITGKLCADGRQATYLSKYLDAGLVRRVRASLGYGEQSQ